MLLPSVEDHPVPWGATQRLGEGAHVTAVLLPWSLSLQASLHLCADLKRLTQLRKLLSYRLPSQLQTKRFVVAIYLF